MKKTVWKILNFLRIIAGIICLLLAFIALVPYRFLPMFFLCLFAGIVLLSVRSVYRGVRQNESLGHAILRILNVLRIIAGMICLYLSINALIPYLMWSHFFGFFSAGAVLLTVPVVFRSVKQAVSVSDILFRIMLILTIASGTVCLSAAALDQFVLDETSPYFYLFSSAAILLFLIPCVYLFFYDKKQKRLKASEKEIEQSEENKDDRYDVLFQPYVINSEKTAPMSAEFSDFDLKSIPKTQSVCVDGNELCCETLKKTPTLLSFRIDGRDYEYRLLDRVWIQSEGYSDVSTISINGVIYYVFFKEVYRLIVYQVYAVRSEESYEEYLSSGKTDSEYLQYQYLYYGGISGASITEHIPHLVIALTEQKALVIKNGITYCESHALLR